eukprot:357274-Chlamydomonas_euryale.AAC.10
MSSCSSMGQTWHTAPTRSCICCSCHASGAWPERIAPNSSSAFFSMTDKDSLSMVHAAAPTVNNEDGSLGGISATASVVAYLHGITAGVFMVQFRSMSACNIATVDHEKENVRMTCAQSLVHAASQWLFLDLVQMCAHADALCAVHAHVPGAAESYRCI